MLIYHKIKVQRYPFKIKFSFCNIITVMFLVADREQS